MIQPGCAAEIEGRSDTSPHSKAALRRLQSLGPEGAACSRPYYTVAPRAFGASAPRLVQGINRKGESTHRVTPPSRRCHPTQQSSTESGQVHYLL